MTATTPTPAHVALVKGLQTAAYDFAVAESGQLLADASNRLCTARDAILDALAQPAFAAPVEKMTLTVAWDDKTQDAIEVQGTGTALRCLKAFLESRFIAAQQPTPAASPDALRLADAIDPLTRKEAPDHLTMGCAAKALRSFSAVQPVEASPSAMRKALEIAVRQNSHDMLMTGEELRQCGAALATVEVAAPVAPTAQPDIFNSLESGGIETVQPQAEPVAEIIECSKMGQQTVKEIEGRWRFLDYGTKLYAGAAPVAQAEQEAAMYRWLRDQNSSLETQQRDKDVVNGPSCYQVVGGVRELKHGDELDSAILAAMKASKA